MVKINFRFTSPGIKVLGLFFFFPPERLVEQSSDQTMCMLLRCPFSSRKVAGDLWWVMFFPLNLKEITEAGRCMPPQGEVKHLLKGGLENDSWGASLLPLHLQSAAIASLTGSRWRRHGSDRLCAWE